MLVYSDPVGRTQLKMVEKIFGPKMVKYHSNGEKY
jgi:hypothetical protein